MKTKGALIREFNQPWTIEEIEIGDPAPGEVKVQMEASGMCHSDHHLVTGGIPMLGFPVLGGHEGAGIVTEVGEGVDSVAVGDHVAAEVDTALRAATVRNHSATHLMHKALREVLGGHVQQKGSLVNAERTRFDFAHNAPVTDAEIRAIEAKVNAEILANAAA